MKVREVLEKKQQDHVTAVSRDATALDAAKLMNQRKIGSVVVTQGDEVIGIFTERDILRRVVAELRDPAETLVGDVMTAPCIVVEPEDTLESCQGIVTQNRVRHLPVVEDGKLIGMITAGDIMAQSYKNGQVEIHYLQTYLYGSSSSEVPKLHV